MSGIGAVGGGGGGAVSAVPAMGAIGTAGIAMSTATGGHSTGPTAASGSASDVVSLSADGISKAQSLDKMSEALLAMLLLKLMEKAAKA